MNFKLRRKNKMKKTKQALIALGLSIVMILGFFTFAATSCELEPIIDNPINNITIVVPTTNAYRNEDFNMEGAFIVVNWVDTTRESIEVPFTDPRVTHNEINTATPLGHQILAVTFRYTDAYGEKHDVTATIRINFSNRPPPDCEFCEDGDCEYCKEPVPTLRIVTYELPIGLRAFHTNTIPDNHADFERRAGFINLEGDQPDAPVYHIGTQNNFQFFPAMTVLDDQDRLVSFTGYYRSNIRVYKRDMSLEGTGEYVHLAEDTDRYVGINAGNGFFRFTAYAINDDYFFKITQQIYQIYDVAAPNQEQFFNENILVLDNIRIIDAFNAHCILDFALLDNRDSINHWETRVNTDYWAVSPRGNDVDMNGLVLHTNITIAPNDIPIGFFYGANRANGLANHFRHQALFFRIHENENIPFQFVGNYFTVNSSAVPFVTTMDLSMGVGPDATRAAVSRISLFSFITRGDAEITAKNFYGLGNAPRNEYLDTARGLKFVRAEGNVTLENLVGTRHTKGIDIVKNSYFNPQLGNLITIRSVRIFDVWQEAIYIQQHDVDIYDSIVLRAGGPAILLVERFFDSTDTGPVMTRGPRVQMHNTRIINYNTAHAAWFSLYGLPAAIMPFFHIDNDFVRPVLNRTMMRQGVMHDEVNFIAFTRTYEVPGQQIANLAQVRSTLTLDGAYLINHVAHVPNNPFHAGIPPAGIPAGVLPPLVVNHNLGIPWQFNTTTFPIHLNYMTVYVDVPLGGGPIGAVVSLTPLPS